MADKVRLTSDDENLLERALMASTEKVYDIESASAAMPSEEEIARAVCASDFDGDETVYDTLSSAQRLNFAINARAIAKLFAPILAEKERGPGSSDYLKLAKMWAAADDRALAAESALASAEIALGNLMNAAGHYKATHSDIDREALSATIKEAAAYIEAAAIRAKGE